MMLGRWALLSALCDCPDALAGPVVAVSSRQAASPRLPIPSPAAGSAMATMWSTVAAPTSFRRSSPLISNSDELYCLTGLLQDVAFGRAHN